jgi:lipoprotein-releasing system permease protein
VDRNFASTVAIEQMMTGGDFVLNDAWGDHCVVGQGLAYELGLRSMWGDSLWMYAPSRGRYSKLMPMSGVNAQATTSSGIFALDAETDGSYVITSIEVAQRLLDYPEGASALKVRLTDAAQTEQVKEQIARLLPEGVEVRSRQELNESMYKVLDFEKLAVLLIGMMILIVASFSVVGTLIMLIIDKKESLATLRALGADTALLRSIFVRQGMAICLLGAVGGFVLGVALSLIQQYAGVIRIPAETFLIDTYPVRVVFADLAIIVVIFTVVSYITTRLTVAGRIKNESIE